MGQIGSGNYIGNGVSGHAIAIGFQPCALIILRSDGTGNASLTIDVGGTSFQMLTQNGVPSNVITLTSTGFTLNTTGTDYNQNTSHYSWAAWARDTTCCDTFSYTGDGTNNRNVGSLAFQPDVAMYFSSASARQPIWWTATSATKSCYWGNGAAQQAPFTNGIVGATSSGLTVSATCNPNTAACHVVAFKTTASDVPMSQVGYTGNATNGHTVAHGLSSTPAVAIVQSYSSNQNTVWRTVFDASTANAYQFFQASPTTNILTNLDATNLTLGTDARSNASAVTYMSFFAGAGLSVALSGQAATVSAGTLTPEFDIPLVGSVATSAAGSLTPGMAIAVTGSSATTATGTLEPGLSLALLGLEADTFTGILTPHSINPFPVEYRGFEVQTELHGIITLCMVAVTDAPAGNVWKVEQDGVTYAVYLVDVDDVHASPVRIQTTNGVKAARLFT